MARRQKSTRTTRARGKPRVERTPPDPRAIAAAAVLALAALLGSAWWGNPYPRQLIIYWTLGSIAVVAVGLVVAKHPSHFVVGKAASAVRAVAMVPPVWFALAVLVLTTALAALIAILVFNRGASTTDELAQRWHARILVHGLIALPVDPNPEFFSLDTVVDVGQWYSQFPIGGPMVLAIGAAVHAHIVLISRWRRCADNKAVVTLAAFRRALQRLVIRPGGSSPTSLHSHASSKFARYYSGLVAQ